jgi:hypothetical protein
VTQPSDLADDSGVLLSVAGTPDERDRDLRDLVRWLERDRMLTDPVRLRTTAPQPGRLGAVADAAMLLAGSAPLAKAVFGWLRERAKRGPVRLTITGPGKRAVTLEAADAAEADALLASIQRHLGGPLER